MKTKLFFLLIFLLMARSLAASENRVGDGDLKVDSALDFKSPFTYVSDSEVRSRHTQGPFKTREGIEHTARNERLTPLNRQYTRLEFSMKKVFGKVKAAKSNERCLVCHRGVEEISENHAFECSRCHKGNPWANDKKAAHLKLVVNPSDFSVAEELCGECHGKRVHNVKHSLMSTAAGEISSTRYYWGSQAGPEVEYASLATPSLEQLPEPREEHPVDDLLRKKCLRCHLNSPSPNRRGDYRATGCAACHMIYGNDGKYRGSGRAILKVQSKRESMEEEPDASGLESPRGYPILHRFTNAIPSVQCVHCHNGNRVGTEYLGYFEEGPERNSAGSDIGKPLLHGAKQTYIVEDIHKERGMHCIDCHTQSEMEGTGRVESSMKHVMEIRCEDCHGTHGALPLSVALSKEDVEMKTVNANPNLKGVIVPESKVLLTQSGVKLINTLMKKGKAVLFSKVTGKKHSIPLLAGLKNRPPSHRITSHMERVECHACHARWTSMDWGLRLEKEGYLDKRGREKLTSSDPSLMRILKRGFVGETLDWLTAKNGPEGKGIVGKMLPGIWWEAFDSRDWNSVFLGVNSRNKISLLKPNYQFSFTSREELQDESDERIFMRKVTLLKNVVPESVDGLKGRVISPYVPHTIRKKVRPCEECHNRSATGQGLPGALRNKEGEDLSKLITQTGEPLQTLHAPGQARFLDPDEIRRITDTSTSQYKYFRYQSLKWGGWGRLLQRDNSL